MSAHRRGPALSRREFFVAGAACAGTLAASGAVGAQPAVAAGRYKLTVVNNSAQFLDVCLFQQPVDLGVPGAMPVAWMTQAVPANRTVGFTWTWPSFPSTARSRCVPPSTRTSRGRTALRRDPAAPRLR